MNISKELILQTKRISLLYSYPDVIEYNVVIGSKDENNNVSWSGSYIRITVKNEAASSIELNITDDSGNAVTDNPTIIHHGYDSTTKQHMFIVHILLNNTTSIVTYHFDIVCSTGTTKRFMILQLAMEELYLPDTISTKDSSITYSWNIVKLENGDGAVNLSDGTITSFSLYLRCPKEVHDLIQVTTYNTSNSGGVREISRSTYDDNNLYVEIELIRDNNKFNSFYGIAFTYGNVKRMLDITQLAYVEATIKELASPVVSLYHPADDANYALVSTTTLRPGVYTFECWGACGGRRSTTTIPGMGGYSIGTYTTYTDLNITVVAGQSGDIEVSNGSSNMPNSGGKGCANYQHGGDGSWICIGDTNDLYARVIVAGGGGSVGASGKPGGYGGGLEGESRTDKYGTGGYGGTQTGVSSGWLTTTRSTRTAVLSDAYAGFGFGGNGVYSNEGYGGAGGGGWYGGSGVYPDGSDDDDRGGGGGSGYVYTADTAVNYPSGCKLNSAHYLTNAQTIAGNSTMPNWNGSGTMTGNAQRGAVRITKTHEYVEAHSLDIPMPTQLEYIENTGAGYIVLDWYPSSDDTRIGYSFTNGTQVSDTIAYFGGRSETGKTGIVLFQVNGDRREDFGSTHTAGSTVTENLVMQGTISKNTETFTSNSRCVIFSVNTNNVIDSRKAKCKFHFLRVLQSVGDTYITIHNYVAAKDLEGRFGVLDTITGNFFYDQVNGNTYITGA